MENSSSNIPGLFEFDFDFKKYWSIVKANWKTIMWITAGGFVFGCIVALCTPRKYEVVSKLAPELSTTTSNRLTSVASMMGMNSALLGTTDAVYPLVYPDVVQSPDFIADLFNAPVSFDYKKEHIDTTLYAYMSSYRKGSPIGAVLGFPGMIVGKIKSLFEEKEPEDYISADGKIVVNYFHFTKKQGQIFKAIQKSIEAEIDKKTLVVSLKVTLDDPLVCATVSQAVTDNLKKTITKYRIQKAVEERDYYQELYDQARSDYFNAQWIYSEYVDSHQNMIMQSVQVEKERLKNETNLLFQVYNTIANQLQSAQAKIQQETPVFAEIVKPTVPQIPVNSRKRTALTFAFLAFCAAICYIIYKNK